jgi:hypothetical protein
MTKKLMLLSFIALALMVGGCSKQNPFEAQSDSAFNDGQQISLAKKVSVPVKGHFETVIETFIPIEFINGQPVKFTMHIVGTGNVSHLGNCTVAFDQVFTPPVLTAPNVVVTAANGDKLYFKSEGTASDDLENPTFSGSFIFTSGTGRFVNAEGNATFTGSASLATMTGEFSFEGMIIY